MIVAIVGLLVGAAMGIMLMCMVIVGDDKGKTWTCELCEREAENAKLRKLLGKYHYTLLAYKEEDDDSPCPLYICPDTTMCPWPWDNAPCPFVEAINELRIEVDE